MSLRLWRLRYTFAVVESKAFLSVRVESEDDLPGFAARVANALRPGDTLCLSGDLGAGKTTFTRSLVAALGSPAPVSSPTFTLAHEYDGGAFPIVHMDCYRLSDSREFEDSGLSEYVSRGDWLALIEWPERIADVLPPDCLWIRIEIDGIESRTFHLESGDDTWKTRLT